MTGRPSTNVSKNHVVWARCHFVGLTSGIDWTVWSSADSGAASASVNARTSAYPTRVGEGGACWSARTPTWLADFAIVSAVMSDDIAYAPSHVGICVSDL